MRLAFLHFVTRRSAAAIAPLMLLMAGCAGGVSSYIAKPINAIFSLVPSAQTVNTNGQIQFKAVAAAGGPAKVNWTVLRGDNDSAIGQGSIDAHGAYTPPPSLSRDSIEVEVQAQLRSDPGKIATEVIEVTPGFLQPLTPENSTLSSGGTLTVTAQLAEVGGGTIEWSLATTPSGQGRLDASYGSFSDESCQHTAQNYTVCSAVYNAPATLPAAARQVYAVATVTHSSGEAGTREAVHILLSGAGLSSTPLLNQSAQTSLVQLGSSGGNNNDADTSTDSSAGRSGAAFINDCCGGTLGALVRDQTGGQYILSNNHVLAESDQASLGDTIVQPGLIDRNCDQNAGRPVASLRYVVPLATNQTNVDAALAEANAGSVDPSGSILALGAPGSGVNGTIASGAPAAGGGEPLSAALLAPEAAPLRVAKSGRTTGLTCSTVDAIDLGIEVDYYKDCAESQPYYRKTYNNQIGIGGDGFSDSGDSGALIVDAGNAQPLGLYFAGGTDGRGIGFSVASPIEDVLAALGNEAGRQFSVVGGAEHPVSCLNYDDDQPQTSAVSEISKKKAENIARKSAATLVNPATGILDIAAGASADSPGDAALLVFIDKTKDSAAVPQTLGGLRTVVIPTDEAAVDNGTSPRSTSFTAGIHLPERVLQEAGSVQQAYARRLMADPAIFGVGVTQSRDNPSEAALLVLVDMARTPRATPPVIGGLRVRYLLLNRFHVTRSRHAGAPHPSSCALRSAAARSTAGFDPRHSIPLNLP